MDTFFYIIIFIMGITFGSFYTLAVYRIPKGQDITHTHSYCPKCNHKLNILDLIPVFSYIFIGGKCRYCKEKIRPRYLILEIISGLFFMILAYSMKLSIYNINIYQVIEYSFLVLYFTFIILMAGIDKESRTINKSVLMYGVIISIIYIIYLCILEKTNIYRYGIYLIISIILLLTYINSLKKNKSHTYIYALLTIIIIMTVFTGEYSVIASIISTLLFIAIYLFCKKNKKTDKQFSNQIKIGYFLSIANVIYFIMVLLLCNII